jgi:hypothetical protein
MSDFNNDAIRWPGSGSVVNLTTVPFGYYLGESGANTGSAGSFEYDCYYSAQWAGKRLGYPVVELEMIDVNFYACFEEAVNEYGAQVNQFNIRNNLLNLQGMSTSTDANNNNTNINGLNLKSSGVPTVIQIAKEYGTPISIGGYMDLNYVPIALSGSQQYYDLQVLIGNKYESGSRIEVRRVFNDPPPAFARIYDPFSMTGMSYSNVLNEMGFAGYSPATQFLMTPIFEDLLRGQAIQFNDKIRKSQYSFELVNNVLKIFPIPSTQSPGNVYIEYVVEKDYYTTSSMFTSGSNYAVVSDYSNAPYQNVTYYKTNAVSKQWIKKYFLALCKETLGRILQKYSTVPIPGGEVTLDGAELRSEATAEKEVLMTQLRENLEASGRNALLEAKANEAQKIQDTLKTIPLYIYIG